jgi:hypothetical protein
MTCIFCIIKFVYSLQIIAFENTCTYNKVLMYFEIFIGVLRLINIISAFLKHEQRAEFLEEIQTKVLKVFLLAIHSHLYSFPLRFLFFKLTQPLTVSTVQLLYTVKEKGGKPDRKPCPLPYGLRNPYRGLKSEKIVRS